MINFLNPFTEQIGSNEGQNVMTRAKQKRGRETMKAEV